MIEPDATYALVPEMHCKGLCSDACGPVGGTAVEVDAMLDAGVIPPGIRLHPRQGVYTCSHLTDEGRCAVYAHRPLICRLWGAVRRMKCEHGCKPAGGYLSDEQAAALFARIDDGRPDHHAAPELRARLRSEALVRAKRQTHVRADAAPADSTSVPASPKS